MPESFTISRVFRAPRELVWDAWTLPEHFAVWFGSDAVEVPLDSVTMEVSVGGKLTATMLIPDGPRIDWEGEFTAEQVQATIDGYNAFYDSLEKVVARLRPTAS